MALCVCQMGKDLMCDVMLGNLLQQCTIEGIGNMRHNFIANLNNDTNDNKIRI